MEICKSYRIIILKCQLCQRCTKQSVSAKSCIPRNWCFRWSKIGSLILRLNSNWRIELLLHSIVVNSSEKIKFQKNYLLQSNLAVFNIFLKSTNVLLKINENFIVLPSNQDFLVGVAEYTFAKLSWSSLLSRKMFMRCRVEYKSKFSFIPTHTYRITYSID